MPIESRPSSRPPATAIASGDPLLDIDAISRRASIPMRMARRLVAERRLPVVKIGRYVRVRASDLEAYLDANTQEGARR